MKSQEARSSSSCAACKFLKRRCAANCRFAPYFHSDEPKKFVTVHKVFGANNVGKILNEVSEDQREDAVNSLVYEAEVRLEDPVYGCIGAIASLQHKVLELQHDLILARACLASCISHHPPFFLDINQGCTNKNMANYVDAMETFDHNSHPFDPSGQSHFP